jgi:hypothetical protein
VSGICDFCSAPDPPYLERSPTFEVIGGVSEGDWASCEECHQLIAVRDWPALEKRGVKAMERKFPYAPPVVLEMSVKHLQTRFRANRAETG